MGPEAMVSSRDAEAGYKVVAKGPDGGLGTKGGERGHENAIERDKHDNKGVHPVEVLMPV